MDDIEYKELQEKYEKLSEIALDMFSDLVVAGSSWETRDHVIGDYGKALKELGLR